MGCFIAKICSGFIDWTHGELEALDNALYPKSDIDRLYLPRRDGGRGLISTADAVTMAIIGLESFFFFFPIKLFTLLTNDGQ